MRTRAEAARDEALDRLSRVNRWLTAGALAGAGVLTAVIADTPLGHAKTVSRSTALASTQTSTHNAVGSGVYAPGHAPRHHRAASNPPAASQNSASSQQNSAPAPAVVQQSAPVVVSGGS
ncbi:MAG: hypothetical protein FWD04_05815 [Conexibacteraceae bacterium]|nr:hypothetical protein [Conexibacteraceae bacterium]